MGEHVSMKPYSEDLRIIRIVKAIDDGMSKSRAARLCQEVTRAHPSPPTSNTGIANAGTLLILSEAHIL